MTRYEHRHQGLILEVDRLLPGCALARAGAAEARVEVLTRERQPGARWRSAPSDPPRSVWRAETAHGTRLRLRYGGDGEWAEFVIDEHGSRVWVSHSDNVAFADAAEMLLGPVFSCVQAQRGNTCLHAAVVSLDGRTVALVGASGAGKSTTALALVRRGGTLVCDDVAVLSDTGGRTAVLPGAPRVRMRADSARSLVGSFESLAPMWVAERRRPAKRYLPVEPGAGRERPWPLDAVYVLEPRDPALTEPSLSPLSAAQALGALMLHRPMAAALDPTTHRADFEVMARIAESVPVRSLRRPDGLDTIERTCAAIVADAGRTR